MLGLRAGVALGRPLSRHPLLPCVALVRCHSQPAIAARADSQASTVALLLQSTTNPRKVVLDVAVSGRMNSDRTSLLLQSCVDAGLVVEAMRMLHVMLQEGRPPVASALMRSCGQLFVRANRMDFLQELMVVTRKLVARRVCVDRQSPYLSVLKGMQADVLAWHLSRRQVPQAITAASALVAEVQLTFTRSVGEALVPPTPLSFVITPPMLQALTSLFFLASEDGLPVPRRIIRVLLHEAVLGGDALAFDRLLCCLGEGNPKLRHVPPGTLGPYGDKPYPYTAAEVAALGQDITPAIVEAFLHKAGNSGSGKALVPHLWYHFLRLGVAAPVSMHPFLISSIAPGKANAPSPAHAKCFDQLQSLILQMVLDAEDGVLAEALPALGSHGCGEDMLTALTCTLESGRPLSEENVATIVRAALGQGASHRPLLSRLLQLQGLLTIGYTYTQAIQLLAPPPQRLSLIDVPPT